MSRRSLETRFWLKVDKRPGLGPTGECWVWTASHGLNGYGHIFIGPKQGRKAMAHRLAWMFANQRTIPAKMQVCHTCDYPPCVNPSHLFVGSQSQNMIDCKQKGRHRYSTIHGSKSRFARLTEQEVRLIRALAQNGARQVDLASRFGMSRSAINHIIRNRKWKHLAQ